MKSPVLLSLLLVLLVFTLHVNAGDDVADANTVIVKGIRDRAFYGNASKADLEKNLSGKGYSEREINRILESASVNIVVNAFERNMSKNYVTKILKDRGFTPDEINRIIESAAVEYTLKALSEGASPAIIRAGLERKGFTSKEIDNILQRAGLQPSKKTAGVFLFPGLMLVIVLTAVVVFLWRRRKSHKKTHSKGAGAGVDVELLKLQDEKKSIEEMIRIAKKKYHNRMLDEESFREIVRDHQKKLIEIEARINQIERRVQVLEEKSESDS